MPKLFFGAIFGMLSWREAKLSVPSEAARFFLASGLWSPGAQGGICFLL
jgi:hypothetical protein